MKCPLCGGDFDGLTLKSSGGLNVSAKRCNQCSGIWFEREPNDQLDSTVIQTIDVAIPNYSLKSFDLVCPNDESLLQPVEREDLPAGSQYWRCPDCEGSFYPKGQLGLITLWRSQHQSTTVSTPRSQAALAGVLVVVGFVMANAALRSVPLDAAGESVLPTSGPNILTLSLLALTYLAGTVLAVLGRRLPIVLMGWGVISICLLGFAVIIFGP